MAKAKQTLNPDRPLTIEEAYASRPRLWWLYTLIVLIVAALLGWSGTSITYKGLATKGITIAQGIGNGLIHPDTNLLFNLTPEGVPYQLLQTVSGFSLSKNSNCATTKLADSSVTGPTINTMRSLSRRE